MILGKVLVLTILLIGQSESKIRLGTECILVPSFVYDHKYVELSIGPETKIAIQPVKVKKAKPYFSIGTGILQRYVFRLFRYKTDKWADEIYIFSLSLGTKYQINKKIDIKLGLSVAVWHSTWQYDRGDETEWNIYPYPDIGFRFF